MWRPQGMARRSIEYRALDSPCSSWATQDRLGADGKLFAAAMARIGTSDGIADRSGLRTPEHLTSDIPQLPTGLEIPEQSVSLALATLLIDRAHQG
jgi:hypothetical protein